MPPKKPDWNKRIKTLETRRRRKKGEGFVTTIFNIEEILDESGEVIEDTVIRFSFNGILIHLSISAAMKLHKQLGDILNLKR
jgi:hypothetical protein